jgi:predicted acylesterase/phospholipase RssA
MENQKENQKAKIKNLVISGGSIWGFQAFGILYQAIQSGFFHMENIESMFMTSVGSVVGIMLALKIDRYIIYNYLIKRPWDIVCKENKCSVLEIYDSKGIIHRGFFEDMFLPLFQVAEIPIDITLAEFYEFNGIDIHIYITELNEFVSLDLSHSSFPEWKLIDAVYASCSIPILFSPIINETQCFIDGGVFVNYPIEECISRVENVDEIFGISLGNNDINNLLDPIKKDSNIFDLLTLVITQIITHNSIFKNDISKHIPYQIHCFENTTIEKCMDALYNKEYRMTLVNSGIDKMKEFAMELQNRTSSRDPYN